MERFANGVNIPYGLASHFLPVVFILGFPLSNQMWSRKVEHVKSLCDTVALDLRVHGGLDKPDLLLAIRFPSTSGLRR